MSTACHEIMNHSPKNRRCHLHKKGKFNNKACECDKKLFRKNMILVNQPSQSASTKEVKKKKRGLKDNNACEGDDSNFFFFKTKHDAREAIIRISKQQMKEVRK